MRHASPLPALLPLMLALAWPALAYSRDAVSAPSASGADFLATGLYTGFLLATALLNLVAACASRRMLHGCFALFVAATGLRWLLVDGLAYGFLPGQAHGWTLAVNALLGAQMVTGSLCQIQLLELRSHHPLLLRYYQWFGIFPGTLVMLASASPLFEPMTQVMFVLLLPAPVLSAAAYWRLWRSGSIAERCIALALPLHFLVMLPATLGNIGLLPFDPAYITLARNASLPVILALHAGIGLKVRALERERKEARQLEAEAVAAAAHERNTREAQERLVSMIAHEVRTPIAVIDAAAHSLRLLDQDGQQDASSRESRYRNIRQAVDRMRRLMELTEAADRLQQGQPPLAAAEPLRLDALSEAIRSALDPSSAQRILIQADPDLAPVEGNTRLLYICLSNLLDNALKYASPDTPIQIDIRMEPAQQTVRWRIRDHGPGIPADQQTRVFERYQRLDNASTQPGLGLGLALSRQIVEAHGGQLTLGDNAWPHGATFTVSLPTA